jgi:hypothetical protein
MAEMDERLQSCLDVEEVGTIAAGVLHELLPGWLCYSSIARALRPASSAAQMRGCGYWLVPLTSSRGRAGRSTM